ncbi:hypothetical protein Zmor_019923 [Zophobas morio]|uniref:Uncharacterized protein n=1 Tax=Zophobas morio TaxID=2755281 RepID=A0AA38I0P3_9CUCU|nr:hypothetical protein Zmor_019923 [Zophobas morio]
MCNHGLGGGGRYVLHTGARMTRNYASVHWMIRRTPQGHAGPNWINSAEIRSPGGRREAAASSHPATINKEVHQPGKNVGNSGRPRRVTTISGGPASALNTLVSSFDSICHLLVHS